MVDLMQCESCKATGEYLNCSVCLLKTQMNRIPIATTTIPLSDKDVEIDDKGETD